MKKKRGKGRKVIMKKIVVATTNNNKVNRLKKIIRRIRL